MEKVVIKPEESGEICEKCGRPMVYRLGRYGRFLACSGFPECRNTKAIVVNTNVNAWLVAAISCSVRAGLAGSFMVVIIIRIVNISPGIRRSKNGAQFAVRSWRSARYGGGGKMKICPNQECPSRGQERKGRSATGKREPGCDCSRHGKNRCSQDIPQEQHHRWQERRRARRKRLTLQQKIVQKAVRRPGLYVYLLRLPAQRGKNLRPEKQKPLQMNKTEKGRALYRWQTKAGGYPRSQLLAQDWLAARPHISCCVAASPFVCWRCGRQRLHGAYWRWLCRTGMLQFATFRSAGKCSWFAERGDAAAG